VRLFLCVLQYHAVNAASVTGFGKDAQTAAAVDSFEIAIVGVTSGRAGGAVDDGAAGGAAMPAGDANGAERMTNASMSYFRAHLNSKSVKDGALP
jgi:hypothetical protein